MENFQFRDWMIALSLCISSLSFYLNWYRGRKLVTIDLEKPLGRVIRPHKPQKFDRTSKLVLFSTLHIHNETRHKVEVVYEEFRCARFEDGAILNGMSAGVRSNHIVLPESTGSFEFTHSPDWAALSEVGETSGIFSRFSNRPSRNVSLSLKITSRSFWRRYKIVKTRTVISASMIQSAISNI